MPTVLSDDTCPCDQCEARRLRERARAGMQPVWLTLAIGLIALIVALVAAGCATTYTPSRPPPGPDTGGGSGGVRTWTLQVEPVTTDGHPIADADVSAVALVPPVNVTGKTDGAGHHFWLSLKEAGYTVCAKKAGFHEACTGVTLTQSRDGNTPVRIVLEREGPARTAIAGRLRIEQGRIRNDAGWWMRLGLADFDLIHLARTGQQATVIARLDAAERAHVGIVRVFASAFNLFHLTPDMTGFEDALRFVRVEANARGIYVLLTVLPDAKLLYPTEAERERILRKVLAQTKDEPGIVAELSNEPWNGCCNGYQSADDPKLLRLAEITAQVLGHKDFVVGDPKDGDNPDASAETIAEAKILARYSNILSLHSSRMGGAKVGADGRLRRHIDHLEGFSDVVSAATRAVGRPVVGWHIEPFGHASIQFVPIPGRNPYEREFDPDAAIAGGLTSRLSGLLYFYHRIAAQNDGTPGLEQLGAFIDQIPAGPECRYLNDSWGGAPSRGFSWNQKVRHWVCGNRAWTLAYGLDRTGTVNWVNGWRVVKTLYESPADETGELARSKVAVYEVAR